MNNVTFNSLLAPSWHRGRGVGWLGWGWGGGVGGGGGRRSSTLSELNNFEFMVMDDYHKV